jgi:hypothetical protein
VKLLNFHRKRNKYQYRFVTINLLQVYAESLNGRIKLPVVKVTSLSEQALFYFKGVIMEKGNELFADYPNGIRFKQLAIDNAYTEYELKSLELAHKTEQIRYNAKIAELEQMRKELYEQTNRDSLSDYEEGKRRDRVKELTAQIAEFEKPKPINLEGYRIRKSMLEHDLHELAHMNTSLLIWQAQGNQN